MNTIYNDGRDAFTFGNLRSECPYPEDSDECDAWLEGWDDARAETKLTDIDQREDA